MKDGCFLTIGIVTYNRCELLKVTLDNIIGQIKKDNLPVQILVSDNISEDATKETVEQYITEHDFVFYRCNEVNNGFSGNFVSVMKDIETEYLWFMGDDDLIEEGGIKKIINLLTSESHQIVSINRFKCTYKMKIKSVDKYYDTDSDYVFTIDNHDVSSIYSFFDKVKTLDGLFYFVSSLILNHEMRKLMLSLEEKENINYLNYLSGVYLIFKAISFRKQTSIKYVSEPLVYWRGENTSRYEVTPVTKTYVNFLQIAEIAEKLKNDNMIYANGILSVARKRFSTRSFFAAGSTGNTTDYKYISDIDRLLPRKWYIGALNYLAFRLGRNPFTRKCIRVVFKR